MGLLDVYLFIKWMCSRPWSTPVTSPRPPPTMAKAFTQDYDKSKALTGLEIFFLIVTEGQCFDLSKNVSGSSPLHCISTTSSNNRHQQPPTAITAPSKVENRFLQQQALCLFQRRAPAPSNNEHRTLYWKSPAFLEAAGPLGAHTESHKWHANKAAGT